MKIGVIGGGGREHALAWKLSREEAVDEVFLLPGNGGTSPNLPVSPMDFPAIGQVCRQEGIDLLVVGPEAPLVEGIVDTLQPSGIRVFGPCRQAARLEGSKVYAKRFMERHGVSTAPFRLCRGASQAAEATRAFGGKAALKYDGLAGGKGVAVCDSAEEAGALAIELENRFGTSSSFVVEERLEGWELSLLAFTDGRTARLLPTAWDYKRLEAGDQGPNTGGMGSVAPIPLRPDLLGRIQETVVQPTLAGLHREGIPYHGVLYFGLMITPEGPKLLEYNVRFGDPETEVILPALHSSLLRLMEGTLDGGLAEVPLEWESAAFLDVVLASGGYPEHYETSVPIQGLEDLSQGTLVFHGGTRQENGGVVTTGGRVLNVVARGNTVAEAAATAYRECAKIHFQGKIWRGDIGAPRG